MSEEKTHEMSHDLHYHLQVILQENQRLAEQLDPKAAAIIPLIHAC